jgi:hypothetical protein
MRKFVSVLGIIVGVCFIIYGVMFSDHDQIISIIGGCLLLVESLKLSGTGYLDEIKGCLNSINETVDLLKPKMEHQIFKTADIDFEGVPRVKGESDNTYWDRVEKITKKDKR